MGPWTKVSEGSPNSTDLILLHIPAAGYMFAIGYQYPELLANNPGTTHWRTVSAIPLGLEAEKPAIEAPVDACPECSGPPTREEALAYLQTVYPEAGFVASDASLPVIDVCNIPDKDAQVDEEKRLHCLPMLERRDGIAEGL